MIKTGFWTSNFQNSQILSAFQKLTGLVLYVTVKIPIPGRIRKIIRKKGTFLTARRLI